MISPIKNNSLRIPFCYMKAMTILFLLMASIESSADIKSSVDYNNWIMYYYQNPTPASIAPNIKSAVNLHLLDDTVKSGAGVFGFIAGAVKNNPDLAEKLVTDLSSINDDQYGLILIGIWYANLPNGESKKIVANGLARHPKLKEKHKFLLDNPVSLLTVPASRGAWALDAFWGYFFATGESAPVLKIISMLPWTDESKKKDIMAMGKQGLYLMAASGAAKWSLAANARQHNRVLEICEEQIPKQPEIISKMLSEIVEEEKARLNKGAGGI